MEEEEQIKKLKEIFRKSFLDFKEELRNSIKEEVEKVNSATLTISDSREGLFSEITAPQEDFNKLSKSLKSNFVFLKDQRAKKSRNYIS